MSDEIDALLGDGFTEELMAEAKANRDKVSAGSNALSLPTISEEEMKERIISNTADIVSKANEALTIALQDLQTTPGDPLSMKGVSDLIGAFTGLLSQFNKTNELYEKLKHEKEMLAMKLNAEKVMNDDNNETAITMTRAQLMADLNKNTVDV